jgi:V-type H+-transporting ATPase subunit a
MKWSVIIGVIQMTLGIILRGLNNLFFEDYLGFFFEFIPQITFMCLLFGYMIALIFIKWNTDYSKDTSNAPSIITILMNLALKKGSVDGKPVWSSVETEEKTNKLFFLISLICIPIILLPKPIIKICQMKNKNSDFHFKKASIKIKEDNKIEIEMPQINNIVNEAALEEIEPLLENDDLMKAEKKFDRQKSDLAEKIIFDNMKIEKEENFSDIFVHQIIETIEFVLGCVSNTASYLRLWALSLAHSQLSKVFFDKSLFGMAVDGNFIFVIGGYFLFANITISVLMGMDLLEAFLHTLRLHWVEFQNKFYYADGTPFNPYSFDLLLKSQK